MARLEVDDGARLAYRYDGPDDAVGAVLMIGGLGDDHRCWDSQIPLLTAKRLRVVRADNRGAGSSEADLSGLTITRMADDLVVLLDALNLDSAVVVGCSMGGLVAQDLAARHAGRVAALAFVATAPWLPEATRLALGLWRELAGAGADGHRLALLDTCLHGFSSAWIERNMAAMPAWTAPGSQSREAFAAQIGAMLAFEPVGVLPDVSTIVLHGREDMVMPLAVAREFLSLNPAATIEVGDCGHAIAIEQTAWLNDALDRFINKEIVDGRV